MTTRAHCDLLTLGTGHFVQNSPTSQPQDLN